MGNKYVRKGAAAEVAPPSAPSPAPANGPATRGRPAAGKRAAAAAAAAAAPAAVTKERSSTGQRTKKLLRSSQVTVAAIMENREGLQNMQHDLYNLAFHAVAANGSDLFILFMLGIGYKCKIPLQQFGGYEPE